MHLEQCSCHPIHGSSHSAPEVLKNLHVFASQSIYNGHANHLPRRWAFKQNDAILFYTKNLCNLTAIKTQLGRQKIGWHVSTSKQEADIGWLWNIQCSECWFLLSKKIIEMHYLFVHLVNCWSSWNCSFLQRSNSHAIRSEELPYGSDL